LLMDGATEIVVLDNMARGNVANLAGALTDPRLRLVVGDMRDTDLLRSLVRDADIVFHQAALRITQCAAEPAHAFEVMGAATFTLFELCAEHRVRRVIAASSASIYGMAPEFPTPETAAPYADRTLYGGLKLLSESLLRSFGDTHGLRYAALRYFNVYGPRMDIHGRYTEVLIRWMERIERGEPPLIFGDGAQTMDFVDVRDVARANVAAMRAAECDRAINIGTGREVSLIDLARAAGRHGPPRPRHRVRARPRGQRGRAPSRRRRPRCGGARFPQPRHAGTGIARPRRLVARHRLE